jgi:hypothetical protein
MDREGLIKEFSLKIASKVVREFEGNDNYTVHDLRNYTELLLNELVSDRYTLLATANVVMVRDILRENIMMIYKRV